jgi:hypothetical protein
VPAANLAKAAKVNWQWRFAPSCNARKRSGCAAEIAKAAKAQDIAKNRINHHRSQLRAMRTDYMLICDTAA